MTAARREAGRIGPAVPTAPSDKALHGLAGASSALLAAALASARVAHHQPRAAAFTVAAAGLGSAALIGVAKELADLAGLGEPELMDALCTVLGGLAAAAATYALVLAGSGGGADPAVLSAPLLSFGVVLAMPVADLWIRSRRPRP